jgi:hypothetical protein
MQQQLFIFGLIQKNFVLPTSYFPFMRTLIFVVLSYFIASWAFAQTASPQRFATKLVGKWELESVMGNDTNEKTVLIFEENNTYQQNRALANGITYFQKGTWRTAPHGRMIELTPEGKSSYNIELLALTPTMLVYTDGKNQYTLKKIQ